MKIRRTAIGLTIISLLCSAFLTKHVNANDFASEYSVSIIGLSVGKVRFETTIKEGSYTLNGSVNAAGVARLFTTTNGKLSVKGNFSDGKIKPSDYYINYKEGKKNQVTTMTFKGSTISNVSNKPAVKKNGDWVEVKAGDLKNALDPITATLVSAKSLRSVCQNTLKMFDGAMRADFPMRYLRTIPFSTTGFKGDAVTCRAQFKPISGYDRNKKEVIWMRDNGYADISFAPVGDTGLYAPVAVKLKTQIGTATIRARRFQTLTN